MNFNYSHKKAKLILVLILVNTGLLFAQNNSKTISLFDGKTLNGWKTVNPNNAHFWSVVDGVITGGDGVTKIPTNTYLSSTSSYENFEFRCLFRITGNHDKGLINSGVQYRSTIKHGKIIGYQADIGKGYWGDIYDEHRRGPLKKGDLTTLKHILNKEGWNSYIIRCKGNKHELYINGVKTNEYFEKDSKLTTKGVFGMQLHSGGNAKIEFKNLTLNQL